MDSVGKTNIHRVAAAKVAFRSQYVDARDVNGARLDRIEVRSKGSWSGVHVNEGGCVAGIEQSHGRQVLFYSEMDLPDSKSVKWLKRSLHQYKYANIGPWRHTVLEPGTFVIIPPAKPHAIYSLERSVASVQLWYQIDTLPLTEISIKLDAPPSPHQSMPDPQIALTSIAQAQFDNGYKDIDTVGLQALCRLMRAPNAEDEEKEDFVDVIILEDSDADDAEEPQFLPEMLPDPAAVAREPVDKKGLLKQLATDMKGRPQPAQTSPTQNAFNSKRKPKLSTDSSPLVLSYPADDPHPVCLRQSDIDTLWAGGPLTHPLIEFRMKHWVHELALADPGLAAQVFMFSPLFYARLSSPEQGYPSVEDWGDATDLAASPFVIVPICEGDHWYLAIIHQPHALAQPPPAPVPASLDGPDDTDTPTTVYTFDSLSLPHPETVSLLRKYLALKYRAPRNPAVKIDTSSSARASRSSSKRALDLNVRAGERVVGKTVEVARSSDSADSGLWMLWNLREGMEVLDVDPALLPTLRSAGTDPDGAPHLQRSNLVKLIRKLSSVEMEGTEEELAQMSVKQEEEGPHA
ncbi:hypothetical protein HWV62_14616 [Athelia sp. TMB]|nr:hypothetical protein HWV62_14616 [Athelia sp. TMB]